MADKGLIRDAGYAAACKKHGFADALSLHDGGAPFPFRVDGLVHLRDGGGRGLLLCGWQAGLPIPASRWAGLMRLLDRCPDRLALAYFRHEQDRGIEPINIPEEATACWVFRAGSWGTRVPSLEMVLDAFYSRPMRPVAELPDPKLRLLPATWGWHDDWRQGAAANYQWKGLPSRRGIYPSDLDALWVPDSGPGLLYEFETIGKPTNEFQVEAQEWLADACSLRRIPFEHAPRPPL